MFTNQPHLRRSLAILLLVALSFTSIGGTLAQSFPDVIPLPNGFQPEGIAPGTGTTFYVGSIPTGAVYRGDLRTGEGDVLVQPQAGRAAIGLKYDDRSGLLFVAGGPTGYAYIYDGDTGANVAAIQLTTLPSFINDVVITRDAAYFTNSFQPFIYRVPLENNGELPAVPTVEEIPLGGDYQFTPGAFNANGIAATPNGKTLIIVNSTEGALYNVDPTTGVATRIELATGAVPNGDGILLQGKTLYVVQNRLNQIAVIELSADLTSGTITELITDSDFRVPTTIARFGNSLYAVKARFGTPPTPDTEYEVVQVSR
ncbi:MAG: superoxide dismutase [Chloroflexota bacterium]|nr:superoxide dismutase [Chloroflexota bacterium]